jgi:PilZ domain
MESTTGWGEVLNEQSIGGDRRHDRRYDIQLELRWKLIRRRRVIETGCGRTIDLSSGGVLFETGCELPVGLNVELSVAWPVRLHNIAPLQLTVQGRIVRSANGWAAVRSVQHEFRTVAGVHDHRATTAAEIRAAGIFLGHPSGLTALGKPH